MLDLYPHQQEALDKIKNGSILWGGVGTGKSRVAVAYYMKMEKPKNVYVITTAKKRDSLDWEKEFARYGVGKNLDATVAGVLSVDSWNNISKYSSLYGCFFIFDEQRLVGSGKWTKAFIKIAKRNHWILLSATPGDTWLDYIPVFVANGFYPNRTEFKRAHVIYSPYSKFPKVDRYVNVGRLVRLRNQILVPMPYKRHTTRKIVTIDVPYDKNLYDMAVDKRWNPYEEKPLRDVAGLFHVLRKIVNSDGSRLEAVRQLLTQHPRLIVFYNFDYELELLRSLKGESCQIPPPVGTTSSALVSKPKLDPSRTASAVVTSSQLKTERIVSTNSMPTMDGGSNSLKGSEGLESWNMPSIADMTPLASEQKQSPPEVSSHSSIASTVHNSSNLPKSKLIDTKATSSTTCSVEFEVAEWNGHKHEELPQSERWLYLVQYVAGAEGWNCIDTNAMAFYSLTYSYKNWHQAQGRIDRLNTLYNDLYYYVLKSRSTIDQAVWKALVNKKSFNEHNYMFGSRYT